MSPETARAWGASGSFLYMAGLLGLTFYLLTRKPIFIVLLLGGGFLMAIAHACGGRAMIDMAAPWRAALLAAWRGQS